MHDCTASIVVFKNPPQMVRLAVESFLSCSLKTALYIVDNSPKPDLKRIFGGLPPVTYHFNGQNVGYGKAHNWAIWNSEDSKYHIILNPDINIQEGTIESLFDFMENNGDIGIVCPKILNEDNSIQYLNRRFPCVLDLFLRRFIPKYFSPWFKKRLDRYEMKDKGYDNIFEVEVMSGAFMFCRKDVLIKLKGFDARYFLYFEDYDLTRKFQKFGYRTVYFPDVSVIHSWGREANNDLRMTMVFITSMIKYFNKWGWRWL